MVSALVIVRATIAGCELCLLDASQGSEQSLFASICGGIELLRLAKT